MRSRLNTDGLTACGLAGNEAERLGHGWVGCEHLLLGLAAMKQGATAKLLGQRGAELDALRREVEQMCDGTFVPEDQSPVPTIRTPRFTVVLSLANIEAERLGGGQAGSEHLLLALLTEGDSSAINVLVKLGVDLQELARSAVESIDVSNETRARYLNERATAQSASEATEQLFVS